MNINIKVYTSSRKSGISVGFGEATFGDNFLKVKFNIINGSTGLKVVWPYDKFVVNGETKYDNKVYFPNDGNRKLIDSNIIKEYNRIVGVVPQKKEEPDDIQFNFGDNIDNPVVEDQPVNTADVTDDIPDIDWDTD